ncbi:unnamed protein product [Prorocentrum cordatum]|uniref:Uncharacterized protein n=1 Tax=Prorocentrum cordatum TaxID=2364126 RepID=A0ABN9WFG7_9DINO|nr:unnamed protein product [Polarella glacialis]
MFTADGSEVRNPSAFVAKIDRYEGGLFTADGEEIRNPSRFASLLLRNGSDASSLRSRSPRLPERRTSKGGAKGDAVLYNGSGEPIWNPEAYIGRITNYDGGLFTADGQEVRNPKAFLAGLSRASPKGGGKGDGEAILYKADGTPILNARNFVANIESYRGGLYTASGQEVRNPHAFVEGADGRRGPTAARPAREEALAYKRAGGEGQASGARRGAKGGGKGPKGGAPLYKADGTPIWNPEAYVAKIYDYDGGLFTSDGQEVRNPQAFVAGLGGKGRR